MADKIHSKIKTIKLAGSAPASTLVIQRLVVVVVFSMERLFSSNFSVSGMIPQATQFSTTSDKLKLRLDDVEQLKLVLGH